MDLKRENARTLSKANLKFGIAILLLTGVGITVPFAMGLVAQEAPQVQSGITLVQTQDGEVTQGENDATQQEPAAPSQNRTPEADQRGATPNSDPLQSAREGSMTLATMRSIITRLDEKVQEPRPGTFLMVVNDFEVMIVTAEQANRMRVMVRVRSAENLTRDELMRISQANLDAALDARYAVGRGVLWATYVHPLTSLHPLQFIEAIGSTVNLAANYGTSYSSGQLIFGGGDSQGIIGRQLIDQLIKKGRPI